MARNNVQRNHEKRVANEQYFTANPSVEDKRHTMHVSLQDFEVDVEASTGVFSAHRLDLGTSVLLRHAPEIADTCEAGTLLDIGCGWGPIALTMALQSPQSQVWAIDTNTRALELTQGNAARAHVSNIHTSLPEDVPEDVHFDVIWSNPPIRVGKDVLHEILLTWLPRLNVGGVAYLVVQRNLGSDSLLTWLQGELGDSFEASKYASSKGFRVLEIRRVAQ